MTSTRLGVACAPFPGRSAAARSVVAALAAALIVAVGLVAPAPTVGLSAWDGSVNLYRDGIFSTQRTWYYCTPADVQMMRNIVRHETDHSRASQDRYFEYMRRHMRYAIPRRHGVDPAGWTAGLRRFVDDRYRLVRTDRFAPLLRTAVKALRLTNRPVALFVDHGNHGWVLHGFEATADPATTDDFTVQTVRVSGPLWGLQNSSYGYDMRPNKRLTRSQLRDFVTRWHYGPIRMVYEGEFLAIAPVAGLDLAGIGAAGVAAAGTIDGATSPPPDDATVGAEASGGVVPPDASAGAAASAGVVAPTPARADFGANGATAAAPVADQAGTAPSGPPLPLIAMLAGLAVLTVAAGWMMAAGRRRARAGPAPPQDASKPTTFTGRRRRSATRPDQPSV